MKGPEKLEPNSIVGEEEIKRERAVIARFIGDNSYSSEEINEAYNLMMVGPMGGR
jgi:hypothetical protein